MRSQHVALLTAMKLGAPTWDRNIAWTLSICNASSASLASSGKTSLLLSRFVFRMAEASAKRVTGDEPQGTMGRVQTVVSFPPSFARTSRETSGYEVVARPRHQEWDTVTCWNPSIYSLPSQRRLRWLGHGHNIHGWWTHLQKSSIRSIDESQEIRVPRSAVQKRTQTWP